MTMRLTPEQVADAANELDADERYVLLTRLLKRQEYVQPVEVLRARIEVIERALRDAPAPDHSHPTAVPEGVQALSMAIDECRNHYASLAAKFDAFVTRLDRIQDDEIADHEDEIAELRQRIEEMAMDARAAAETRQRLSDRTYRILGDVRALQRADGAAEGLTDEARRAREYGARVDVAKEALLEGSALHDAVRDLRNQQQAAGAAAGLLAEGLERVRNRVEDLSNQVQIAINRTSEDRVDSADADERHARLRADHEALKADVEAAIQRGYGYQTTLKALERTLEGLPTLQQAAGLGNAAAKEVQDDLRRVESDMSEIVQELKRKAAHFGAEIANAHGDLKALADRVDANYDEQQAALERVRESATGPRAINLRLDGLRVNGQWLRIEEPPAALDRGEE